MEPFQAPLSTPVGVGFTMKGFYMLTPRPALCAPDYGACCSMQVKVYIHIEHMQTHNED